MQNAPTRITCWGELVWDVFADEPSTLNGSRVLGGSATAVAAQLAALGAEVRLVSAVGDDPEGERALRELAQRGISVSGVCRVAGSPTAALAIGIQAEGEPEYETSRRLDWAAVDFEPGLSAAVVDAHALTFGLFAQGACLDLGALERALLRDRPRLVGCDLNLRRAVPPDLLARVARNVDFLKLNQREYERVAQALAGDEPTSWLLRAGRTQLVALTLGDGGARLITPNEVFTHAAHAAARLVDTVGAGDAFMAALTLALVADLPPQDALASAVARAEAQLSVRGAMPVNRGESG